MRGKKGSPYDGGHRVPFLLRYPGAGANGGRDVGQLTSYVDFMPTILDLCGVTPPADRSFHGSSLTPLMRGDHDGTWGERILVADTQRIANPAKWRLSSVMRGPWRLVHGLELYDLRDDPGQRNDIAAEHPDVVAELRAGYEQWWELVSEQFDRDVPMVIGQDAEPVRLTTHDMRNEACNGAWNQRQVREGYVAGGYWAIDVRRAGSYRIELRRWPEDAGYALDAGIDGDDIEWRRDAIQEQHAPHYSGGVALPIGWAALTVGGRSYHAETPSGDTAAAFEVDLQTGPDRLSAAFHDRIERTIGSYYVHHPPPPAAEPYYDGRSPWPAAFGSCSACPPGTCGAVARAAIAMVSISSKDVKSSPFSVTRVANPVRNHGRHDVGVMEALAAQAPTEAQVAQALGDRLDFIVRVDVAQETGAGWAVASHDRQPEAVHLGRAGSPPPGIRAESVRSLPSAALAGPDSAISR